MILSNVVVNKIFDVNLDVYTELYQLKVPFLLMTQDGKFVFANRAALLVTGYTEAEIKSITFSDLFKSDVSDPLALLKNNGGIDCAIKLKHQEKSEIPVHIKAYGVRNNEKRNFYYQIILKDMYLVSNLSIKKNVDTLLDQVSKFNTELEKYVGTTE